MKHTDEFRKLYTCDAPAYLPEGLRERLQFLSCLSEKESREVYLVRDKLTGDKCVLKITGKQSPDSAKSEYEILSGLCHAGIPRCVAFDEDAGGREYILRTYIDGDALDRLLERDGTFEELQIYDIVLKICAILRYMHRQQPPIIYRDINPCNIVLTANGKVGLIDFGISKKIRIDDRSKSYNTVIVGTMPFISPEQMGYGKTDQRSDIFALGKLMLYMYTGQADAAVHVTDRRSARLFRIITKCTRQSMEKRFPSISRLERAIQWARRKPGEYICLRWALMCVAAVSGIIAVCTMNAGRIDNAYPAQAIISVGVVDNDLPVHSPELVAAVRRALGIGDGTRLTADMLDNVTAITITADDDSDEKKAVLAVGCLDELKYFTNLTRLSVDGFQLTDLAAIGGLGLSSLSITNSRISNISALGQMTALESLDLSNNPVEDIATLALLGNLRVLDLSYTYVRDITPLGKLSGLSELNLCATRATDFSALADMPGLSVLRISHVQIKDFAFLSGLVGLTHLELRSTGFRDIGMIKSSGLTSLDISLNYNYLTDISGLVGFSGLRELDISLNDIKDYTTLYALPQLRVLGIHEDQSEHFLPTDGILAGMPRLSTIILTANELTDTWRRFEEQSGVEVVLRTYYEAY